MEQAPSTDQRSNAEVDIRGGEINALSVRVLMGFLLMLNHFQGGTIMMII